MKRFFKKMFNGRVVIIGVGNILRADDGFGPMLIERIKGKVKAACIDAGSAPENYIGKIIQERPDTIIIADAVCMGFAPGEYGILDKSEILKSGLTTHDVSPSMFIEHLQQNTEADIYMLGVEPERIALGEEMTAGVKKALAEITELITEVYNA